MRHDEFISKWNAGELEVDVNRPMALQVVGSKMMPGNYRAAHMFWSWIWMLSIPAAIAVGYFYVWWAGLLMLLFLTPLLSSSTKKSAMQFMIDHSVENADFFSWSCENSLLTVRDKGAPTDAELQTAAFAEEAQVTRLRNLVADYGDVLGRFNDCEVADARELPAGKDDIKAALKFVFLGSSDAPMRDTIGASYVMLARFQDGVGEPIRPLQPPAGVASPPPDGDAEALAAWSEANRDAVDRFARALISKSEEEGGWREAATAEMNALAAEWREFEKGKGAPAPTSEGDSDFDLTRFQVDATEKPALASLLMRAEASIKGTSEWMREVSGGNPREIKVPSTIEEQARQAVLVVAHDITVEALRANNKDLPMPGFETDPELSAHLMFNGLVVHAIVNAIANDIDLGVETARLWVDASESMMTMHSVEEIAEWHGKAVNLLGEFTAKSEEMENVRTFLDGLEMIVRAYVIQLTSNDPRIRDLDAEPLLASQLQIVLSSIETP